MKSRASLAFAFAVLALVGCSSTGVGNPPVAEGTLALTLTQDPTVEPEATDDGEQLGANSLRRAMLVFGELRFIACDSSDSDEVLSGPFTVDLAQNRVEPPIGEVPVPQSGFCGIDGVLAPAVAPATLAGRSMFFSGLRADGTLFILFADMPGTLRMRPRSGAVWPAEDQQPWIWAMRPRRWLLPSELDAESPSVLEGLGNVIAIDVGQHPILYSKIRARIARRSSLHLDLNQNGSLDSDERLGDAFIGLGLDSLD